MGDRHAADPPTGRPGSRVPTPLTPRQVGLLMLVWTAAIAGWFGYTMAVGGIGPVALALAVGGLFAVIWLLGLMVLALFLAGDA